jgi:hypothetical protein
MSGSMTIRYASDGDARDLVRLGALDSSKVPLRARARQLVDDAPRRHRRRLALVRAPQAVASMFNRT